MRNSRKSQVARGAIALAVVVAGAGLLAGCTSMGSRSLGSDPTVTGSVGTSAAADLSQPMPGILGSTASTGPYTPPADIGGNVTPVTTPQPIVTGSIPTQTLPPATSQSPLSAQDLAVLRSQSSLSGSSTDMTANPAVAQTVAQPAPITAVPQLEPAMVEPVEGYTHAVEPGESLYVIARRYDVSTDAVVDANNLGSPDRIFVGQELLIPGRPDLLANRARAAETAAAAAPQEETDDISTGSLSTSVTPATPQAAPEPVTETAAIEQPAAAQPAISNADKFRWPVSGRVIVDFASTQTGINIEVPEGAAIRAAENGQVIYAGDDVEGYGNMVLIRHSNGFVSAYAHLKEINVVRGETVTRGDTIGSAGMTGSVNRPQLHFELRKGATPVDPVPLMVS
jgi:murein DD-endopeptidase MepM/ murein hydrolase activator NlpD